MSYSMMSHRFAGKVALVTGGSRNIGLSICSRLAREGARVFVNGIVPGEAATAAKDLRDIGLDAIAVEADVSDEAAVTSMIAEIMSSSGRLDVLVNNAAIPMVGRVHLFDLDIKDWDRSFAVNARGTFLCTVASAQVMSRDGAIVNISSIGASKAHRSAVAYDATKGAIESLTRATSLELAPFGIRVNAVAPGAVSNDRYQSLSTEIQLQEVLPIPLGRAGIGEDVAAAVAFLASSEASYITGQVLTIDGGLTAQARQETSELDIEPVSNPPSERTD